MSNTAKTLYFDVHTFIIDHPVVTPCHPLKVRNNYASWRVIEALGKKTVPENEKWRLGLLTALLSIKMVKFTMVQDSKAICAMIDSLSST